MVVPETWRDWRGNFGTVLPESSGAEPVDVPFPAEFVTLSSAPDAGALSRFVGRTTQRLRGWFAGWPATG